MRTKNAKRLWPVPATLAVVALAAFLALGLLAVNRAQPAAAQDADCTISIDATNQGEDNETLGITSVDGSVDRSCNAFGDTATIKFVGPENNPNGADAINLYVLVKDKSGSLSFYANTDIWQSETAGSAPDIRRKGTFYDALSGSMEAKPTKYTEMDVSVPRAKRQGAQFVRQSTTVSVKGEGSVHVYLPEDSDTDIVADFVNSDCTPACDAETPPPDAQKFVASQPTNDSSTISITFFGKPSLTLSADDEEDCDHDDNDQTMLDCDDADSDVNGDLYADKDDKPDPSSDLYVANVTTTPGSPPTYSEEAATDVNADFAFGSTGPYDIEAATDNERLFAVAIIKDAKGNPLADTGDNKAQGRVTFTISYAAGSALESNPITPQTMPVGTGGKAMVLLDNWKSTGAVSATVTAVYSGAYGQQL